MTTKQKITAKKSAARKTGAKGRTAAKGKAAHSTVTLARVPSQAAIPPPRNVSIEVLLTPAESGLSPVATEERISCANIASFRPTRAKLEQAARLLTDMGFRVVAYSPYSISVEGTPARFTKTFGTQLEILSLDRVQGGRPLREKAFYAPASEATWEPPNHLKGIVERAYIHPPAIYFESALPPSVGYFNLKVPGDVAMLTRASEVHQQGITGKGVKVVMIDSGFFNHQFYQSHGFKAAVVLAPGALNPQTDNNGHGTAHAANVFATAPGITFAMVKQGTNPAAAFKRAIDLAPDIIICSWGFDLVVAGTPNRIHQTSIPNSFKSLELEVVRAAAQGICVICASGNGQVAFPGMHPDVISAGGVFVDQTAQLSASNLASAFDSRPYPGRHVPDVCGLVGLQPAGVYIMLPLQPGCDMDRGLAAGDGFPAGDETLANDGWIAASGTSSAAPQIAGVCALLKQKNPALTPQEIKQALIVGAVDCARGAANAESNQGTALKATAGADGATGHGLINAAASVALV